MAKIKSSIQRQLEVLPLETSIAVGARAALRVFPFVTHSNNLDASRLTLTLLTARCILSAGVSVKIPSPDVIAARTDYSGRAEVYVARAASNTDYTTRVATYAAGALDRPEAVRAAVEAARAAADAALAYHATDAVRAIVDVQHAAPFARNAEHSAMTTSGPARAAAHSDLKLYYRDLMAIPIWGDPLQPDWLNELLDGLPNILDSGSEWAFWRDWYEGFLIGKPLEWELQHQVALIDDKIWEVGPKAVAAEIERIEAKFRLEREIARLKEQLAQTAIAPIIDRKHNNPPPLDDEGTAKSEVITLIWDDLEKLDRAVAEETPNPDEIKLIAQRLWALAAKIAIYCGNKIDIALEAAVKEASTTGTKWAIRTGVAYYAATQEGTQSVAKLAWQYAERLLSGG